MKKKQEILVSHQKNSYLCNENFTQTIIVINLKRFNYEEIFT